jgi:hypothetical protein
MFLAYVPQIASSVPVPGVEVPPARLVILEAGGGLIPFFTGRISRRRPGRHRTRPSHRKRRSNLRHRHTGSRRRLSQRRARRGGDRQ